MINDFIVLVREVGSEADGPRLMDICNDFREVCLFLSKDETFSFFAEDCEVTFEVGLYTLRVEDTGGAAFETGAAGFFVVFIMFLFGGVFLLVTVLLVVGFVLT